ncbi:MAG: hypothetical protein AAFR71_09245 [Pseudomonadota bacterium]
MMLAEIRCVSPVQWSALLLVVLGAVIVQRYFGFHPDVSWLLTLNERLIAGEKLYVDLLVVNPAVPVWVYRVPVLIAEATGLPAELVLHVMMAATALVSFILTTGILRHANLIAEKQVIWLLITLLALFYIVSAHTFAEREHIALFGLLPWLALQAWRFENPGQRPDWRVLVLCGFGCAAPVLVKPYYALTILSPVVIQCIMLRSIKPAFHIENLIGAFLTVLGTGLFVILHPAFFADMMDVIMSTYAPYNTPFRLVYHTFALTVVLVAIVLRFRPRDLSPLTLLLVASAYGHLAALWIMGRALPYHAFPAYVLMALAVMSLYRTPQSAAKAAYVPALICIAALWGGIKVFAAVGPNSEALLQYLAENHSGKTYLPISHIMEDGHPISRAAGLTFIAPAAFLSTTVYGDVVAAERGSDNPELLAQIQRSKAIEQDAFRRAIVEDRPMVVVIPQELSVLKPDALARIWTEAGPQGRPASFYQLDKEIDGFRVYTLRDS